MKWLFSQSACEERNPSYKTDNPEYRKVIIDIRMMVMFQVLEDTVDNVLKMLTMLKMLTLLTLLTMF